MILFSVQAKLPSRQHIRLLGNLEQLGKWSPFDSLKLQPSSVDCSSVRTWSINVDITTKTNVSFRYFICEDILESDQDAFSIVKCGPRQESPVLDKIVGELIEIDDPTWCDGWLLRDSEVRLTVHNASGFPINLFEEKSGPGKYTIKVTPMDKNKSLGCFSCRNASDVNVKIVGEYSCIVENQKESGVCYNPCKHYSFCTRVLDPNDTVFKVEICLVDGPPGEEVIVRTIGQGFIKPIDLKSSCGVIDVGLVHKDSPAGSLHVEYIIIKPLEDKHLHNVDDWMDRNWQNTGRTLNMGHRGCGSTFGSGRPGVQENTIESFLMAYEKGADGLELDVHVTKDRQPVIYHDLYLKVPLKTKNGAKCSRRIPVFDFTYQELQDLQITHTESIELNDELQNRSSLPLKLFPTLEEVLNALPETFPFELEIKYLETEKDQEEDDFLDVNVYVDTLLKSIFKNIGKRKIILMCFSPVIVQLLSRKQKKLPVKIAVCGETEKYPVYRDTRIRTVGGVVAFAESENILGISCFCDHVIQNKEVLHEIRKRNLVLSTWGEDDNKDEIREKQRQMGVNVLCFDRIHEACFS